MNKRRKKKIREDFLEEYTKLSKKERIYAVLSNDTSIIIHRWQDLNDVEWDLNEIEEGKNKDYIKIIIVEGRINEMFHL